jgi:phage tail-like protein
MVGDRRIQILDNNTVKGRKSSYLQYLPGIYRDDVLMGQLLLIFESMLTPVEHTVDNLDLYLDPLMVPGPLLSWLASWLGLSLDPGWPENRRRDLIKSASELYRWRGTRWGLSEYIRIYTGIEPEIHEYMPGMTLDPDTKLGARARLGSGADWYHFTVILRVDKGSQIDDTRLRAIIETQKPAHSIYSLQIMPGSGDIES